MPREWIQRLLLSCSRCKHKWHPHNDEPPKICPHCKSTLWDKPRTLAEIYATPAKADD